MFFLFFHFYLKLWHRDSSSLVNGHFTGNIKVEFPSNLNEISSLSLPSFGRHICFSHGGVFPDEK